MRSWNDSHTGLEAHTCDSYVTNKSRGVQESWEWLLLEGKHIYSGNLEHSFLSARATFTGKGLSNIAFPAKTSHFPVHSPMLCFLHEVTDNFQGCHRYWSESITNGNLSVTKKSCRIMCTDDVFEEKLLFDLLWFQDDEVHNHTGGSWVVSAPLLLYRMLYQPD